MSSFSVPRYRKNLINSRVQIGLRAIITHARSGMSLNLPAVFLIFIITHVRSGMSLNLPAVFLFLFIIIFVTEVSHRHAANPNPHYTVINLQVTYL